MYLRILSICFGILFMVLSTDGHGRLINPPSRVSAWRYGFNTPIEHTDNEFNCGGFSRQWNSNGGKCGICGDPWDVTPRPGEAGGRFPTGIIVKTYRAGDIIEVSAEITANHLGYLEYKLCPVTNPSVQVTQECLDQTPLPLSDGSGYKYNIGSKRGTHRVQLQLPENFACDHCVLQWRYRGGNNWGQCDDGSGGKLGCGPQEEFRACADIAITNNGGVNPPNLGGNTESPNIITTESMGIVTTEAMAMDTTVAGPITAGDCSSSFTGFLRDPTNCSRFYRCVDGNKKPFLCPSGLAFNIALSVCDWPYNVPGC